MASADNSTVASDGQAIIDANGTLWTVVGSNAVYMQPVATNTSIPYSTDMLLYHSNTVYARTRNTSHEWYYWDGSTWQATTDPR